MPIYQHTLSRPPKLVSHRPENPSLVRAPLQRNARIIPKGGNQGPQSRTPTEGPLPRFTSQPQAKLSSSYISCNCCKFPLAIAGAEAQPRPQGLHFQHIVDTVLRVDSSLPAMASDRRLRVTSQFQCKYRASSSERNGAAGCQSGQDNRDSDGCM